MFRCRRGVRFAASTSSTVPNASFCPRCAELSRPSILRGPDVLGMACPGLMALPGLRHCKTRSNGWMIWNEPMFEVLTKSGCQSALLSTWILVWQRSSPAKGTRRTAVFSSCFSWSCCPSFSHLSFPCCTSREYRCVECRALP